MVLIPAGSFLMGKGGNSDSSPQHSVELKAFLVDRTEVTNADYARFCTETGHQWPEFWTMSLFHCGPDFPHHPVVGVSWADASAYADWAEKRLPTEAEGENAARGGLSKKKYPNGNDLDSALANITTKGVRRGTVAVGQFNPNQYGLVDMAGNVVEWVQDYYQADYYSQSPESHPPGPKSGKFRVIRGGGWHSGATCNRVYYRNALPGNWVDISVGFRCARDLEH